MMATSLPPYARDIHDDSTVQNKGVAKSSYNLYKNDKAHCIWMIEIK